MKDQQANYLHPDQISFNPLHKEIGPDLIREISDGLEASIKIHGIKNPLKVYEIDSTNETYMILSGTRRLKIAKELGIDKIPCIIIPKPENRSRELLIMIGSNMIRQKAPVEIEELGKSSGLTSIEAIMYLLKRKNLSDDEIIDLYQDMIELAKDQIALIKSIGKGDN